MTDFRDPTRPSSIDALVTLEEYTPALSVLRAEFLQAWFDGSRPYLHNGDVEHSIAIREVLPPDATILRAITGSHAVHVVAHTPIASILATVFVQSATFEVIAASDAEAKAVLTELLARAAVSSPARDVSVSFVSHRRERDQSIEAVGWSDARRNYSAAVQHELDRLVGLERPADAGKLILWDGPPGTGKTSAVRTLMREWAGWCASTYITDPELLFSDPEYLLRVVTEPPDRESGPTLDRAGSTEDTWRLVIVEDSDQFLRSNARAEVGASLGRLLNVTDGILGQGVNAIILITTNEELARLHPAVTRPGRCLAQVSFGPLSPAEVVAWRDDDRPAPRRSLTLAELFAIEQGTDTVDDAPVLHTGAYL